ncbi:cryptochrome/photolyase family protein [Corynebacterium heidelbergense]|uniref:Deoxyribodipyrimidine photo-lyase n=1 Tax=Corynebacterium heidelbergense TaxID=2055947 RepID=A0A364V879_9CORY|nr:deoxyribodipyrimidine photo-lyase [Corynebacterium heidelbergense]RAV32831.1 deoxyribodipyrimidine photo-lyase [Corynebacterium heidelbergense]
MTTLVWFREDLRTADHLPLRQAAAWAREADDSESGGGVVALFVLEDARAARTRPLGAASKWWLHHSLMRHREKLAELGIPLFVRAGDPRTIVSELAADVGATRAVWHDRYHQPLVALDAQVREELEKTLAGPAEIRTYEGHYLTEPGSIQTNDHKTFKVYTPFARRAREVLEAAGVGGRLGDPPQPVGDSARLELPAGAGKVEDLGLLDTERDWAAGFREAWQPGEDGAHERLARFLDHQGQFGDYATRRDFPAVPATSNLSPHLRFGEISVARLWVAAEDALAHEEAEEKPMRTFQQELLWRDFAAHRLAVLPDMARTNVRRQFDNFPWAWAPGPDPQDPMQLPEAEHAEQLREWQRGLTGVPLVDAGMRELWHTGTMHNRVRMVVGSWLTKNLGIHWRHGEEWFWDTLVDADPASNPFNWQWVAGCGDDASPYFRIFNPLTQEEKFDPDGEYVKRWVPERFTPAYPEPQVDVKESRKTALAAYEDVKAEARVVG